MWVIYAVLAAVAWGISYAASGRVIERGVSPFTFFTFSAAFSLLAAFTVLACRGRLFHLGRDLAQGLGGEWVWFIVALAASSTGSLLIFMSIGEKNATLASLIEISYPFFVAFFAWLFFREVHLSPITMLGGLMILGGVALVFTVNR